MSYIGASPTQVAFVTDTFSGNGSTTAFTMSVAPANAASVLVAISGVLQDPTTYSVAGTTLTFSAAPPAGAGNISSRYLGIPASNITTTAYRTITEFTATAGQTTFTPASYTVGFIEVYRNGVLLGSADYTASNGTTVVLAVGATAGDLVTVVGFYVSSVINAIPATTGSVNSTYIAAGAVGATQIAAGAVGSSQIATGAVGTTQLAAGAVAQVDLAANVVGNGPAFSAYGNGQTLPSTTITKIQLPNEQFDTNSNFDSTTNYRFTPTVAGYYQVNGLFQVGASYTNGNIYIYKNGTQAVQGLSNNGGGGVFVVNFILYMNGSTDYIEMYGYVGTGQALVAGNTFFQGFLARAA